MILSHSHRFVFIKTRKTAGSSLQKYLQNFLDPKTDIITGFSPGEGKNRNYLGTPFEHPRKRSKGWGHMGLADVLKGCPEAKDYFKFTIERNSWDKVVSYYHFTPEGKKSDTPFTEFVKSPALPVDWAMYARAVDMVLQFADFERGIPELGEALGLPLVYESFREYRLKSKLRPPGTDYRSFYDDDSREIIADRYRREIRAFGYEF